MKVVRHLTLTLEYEDGADDEIPGANLLPTLVLRDADAEQIAAEVAETLIACVHRTYLEETGFLDGYFFAGMSLVLSDDTPDRTLEEGAEALLDR
jgi:hypothetical protein